MAIGEAFVEFLGDIAATANARDPRHRQRAFLCWSFCGSDLLQSIGPHFLVVLYLPAAPADAVANDSPTGTVCGTRADRLL
jgi:hypothetical protein